MKLKERVKKSLKEYKREPRISSRKGLSGKDILILDLEEMYGDKVKLNG